MEFILAPHGILFEDCMKSVTALLRCLKSLKFIIKDFFPSVDAANYTQEIIPFATQNILT